MAILGRKSRILTQSFASTNQPYYLVQGLSSFLKSQPSNISCQSASSPLNLHKCITRSYDFQWAHGDPASSSFYRVPFRLIDWLIDCVRE